MEIRSSTPRNNKPIQTRAKLVRSADGRLRTYTGESDIGDVWAEQRRIRLAEAIEEDKKTASRQRLKTERGFVGLTAYELSIAVRWIKVQLFGQQSVKPKPKLQKLPSIEKKQPINKRQVLPRIETTKTVEIKLSLPKSVNLAKQRQSLKSIKQRLTMKRLVISAAALVAVIAIFTGYRFWSNRQNNANSVNSSISDEHHSSIIVKGTPSYATILPNGKSIQQLGGWARISPPDQNPVYAFADKVSGIDVAVSEQPLPPNFQNDSNKQLTQLAKSVGASLKLSGNDGTTIYLGTAPQGPQSVFLTKDNLLILIKSDSPVPDNQWISYVNSLQ